MALDLTAPISWIKKDNCQISESKNKCGLILDSEITKLKSKLKGVVKQKINTIIKKLKIKIAESDNDTAIIEGSNEIVMGQIE
jgi:hypothetical protein